jgi:NtrC-family two-component system response regulator AlgB
VKGAFTGAVRDTHGKVHAADGGTLFLDEIGELPVEIQPKLLRLLQDWEYERVGETKTRRADVRVIAATNRDLHKEVRVGRFREDLYFRLNVIAVDLPALRDRAEDILNFAESYRHFFSTQYKRPVQAFSPTASSLLQSHPWPGNLRELRNAVERAVILARGKKIEPEDLPMAAAPDFASLPAEPSSVQIGGPHTLQDIETAHLLQVIQSSPTLSAAATTLGIDESTLYRKRKIVQE